MKRKLLLRTAIIPGMLATAAMGQVVNFHDDNNDYAARPPIDSSYYNMLYAGQGAYSDPGNNIWNGFGYYGGGVFQSTYVYSGDPSSSPWPEQYGNPGNPYSAYNSGSGWVSCTGPNLFLFSTASLSSTGNATSAGLYTPITLSISNYTGDTTSTPEFVQNGTPAFLFSTSSYANGSHSNAVFTLKHVPAGTYGLFLYGANPDNNRGTTFLVSSGTPHNGIGSTLNTMVGSPATAFVEGGNFVIYENVTPNSSGNITITGLPNAADGVGNANLTNEADVNGFQLIFNPPPTALFPTVAQNVFLGGTASFSFNPVFAAGATYQWQFVTASATNNLTDGAGISGSKTTNLVVTGVASGNVGAYQCVITTATATNTTPAAPLTIISSVAQLVPGSATNVVGSFLLPGDVLADINNPAPPAYYGYQPMNAVPQDVNHSVTNVEDGDLQSYINVGGNGTSQGFSGPVGFSVTPQFGATVIQGLRFFTSSSHPEDDPADYGLFGSNDGGNTYTPISGGLLALPNARNLAAGPINVTNQALYEVDFANGTAYTSYELMFTNVKNDSLASNGVQLAEVQFIGSIPASPPTITEAPASTNEQLVGTTYASSIVAGGPGPFNYTWTFDGSVIPTATNATLTISNIGLANSGTYIVKVTTPYGSVYGTNVLIVETPTPYESTLLSYNPLGYWPLNETAGTNVYDYVGGHNGTYSGTYYLGSPGIPYKGFGNDSLSTEFEGGIASIPEGPFNITGPVTIMGWVQLPFTPTAFDDIGGRGDSSYRLSVNATGEPGFNDGGNSSGDATSSASISDGNWHFVAGVYSGGTGTTVNGVLYVDGVPVASNYIYSVAGSTYPLEWGGAPDYTSRDINAYLSHMAVFAQALTPSQILTIYAGAENGPSVSMPVSSVTVDQGATAVIPSTPSGPPPLSFQWYYSNSGSAVVIPGATNQSLTLTNVQLVDSSYGYYVVVANPFGSVTSSFVTLNILTGPPTITTDITPLSSDVPAGVPLTFSVSSTGTEPFSYTWYQDGAVISGASKSSLTITALGGSNSYYVIIGNTDGSAQSSTSVVYGGTNTPPAVTFGDGTDWTLNTGATSVFSPTIVNGVLTLTDGANSTDTSAFYNTPQYIGSFFASYVYQASGNRSADGITFTIELATNGVTAVGGGGGELGYFGISNSAAFEMNIYTGDSGGPGVIFATNGMVPSQDIALGDFVNTSPVNIAGGDPINVQLYYGASTMNIWLTDLTSGNTFNTNFTLVNLPGIIGDSVAYVGFTGATGGLNSIQTVSNFVFSYSVPDTLTVTKGTPGTVNVTWPVSVAPEFTLQQSTNVLGPWTAVSTAPTVVNGKNEVTVPTSGAAEFFRLSLQ